MSSPIAIRRSSISSSSSASSASASSSARALYVPVHKRRPSSSASSVGSVEGAHQSESPVVNTSPTIHSRIYSADFLLSLRPFAAAGLKEKILAACPEAVMNHRMRKRVEYTSRSVPKSTTTSVAAKTTATATTITTRRITPRRTRFSGRAPERRRQALNLHHDSWRGLRNTSAASPLISL